MNDEELMWEVIKREKVYSCPVYDVIEQTEKSFTGITGKYMTLKAPSWVMVIPKTDDGFILVRQYRHALEKITDEFPGGVCDENEEPLESAKRELLEETGYTAGKMTLLGSLSPNPALFSNRVYIYLAEDLVKTGDQELDDDEFINCMTLKENELLKRYADGRLEHAFMGSAIAFYFIRKKMM